jgi:hypothetical protein
MRQGLGDIEGWVPDSVQGETSSGRMTGRRRLIPAAGDAFFVYGEYDDGNGMWIMTGVSR